MKFIGKNRLTDLLNLIKESFPTNSMVDKKIGDAIAGITGLDFSIISVLPTSGEKGIIYLLPADKAETNDIYEEYIWIDKWEHIGSTKMDLSDYAKSVDVPRVTDIYSATSEDAMSGKAVASAINAAGSPDTADTSDVAEILSVLGGS